MLSAPSEIGVYRGVTEMNLGTDVSRNIRNNDFILLVDGTEEPETRGDLLLWSICLNNCTNDCNVYVLRADIVR
jgi:hypothetical protein